MFLRVRRLFGIFAAWHLPADGPASRASRLRLFIYFIVLSVNAFPHALRWVRHRDPTARARVKQLLNYDLEFGQGRYGIRLWMLLTFMVWHSLVIEGETL